MKQEYMKPTAKFLSLVSSQNYALGLGDLDDHAYDPNNIIGGSTGLEENPFE